MKSSFIVLMLLFLLCSCTNRSKTKFSGVSNSHPTWDVILSEAITLDKPYHILGDIRATVKKNMLFFPNPTKKQVDEELIRKARIIGADAVIQLNYKGGIGFTTWSYMEATGTAVKFNDSK